MKKARFRDILYNFAGWLTEKCKKTYPKLLYRD